jgi:hypothetical protein
MTSDKILRNKELLRIILQNAIKILNKEMKGSHFDRGTFGVCFALLKASQMIPDVNYDKLYKGLNNLFKKRYRRVFSCKSLIKNRYYPYEVNGRFISLVNLYLYAEERKQWYEPRINFLKEWIKELENE